jgi:hypothetical protein
LEADGAAAATLESVVQSKVAAVKLPTVDAVVCRNALRCNGFMNCAT